MTIQRIPRTVLITGANGNLGSKAIEALGRATWCKRIVGIDRTVSPSKFSADTIAKLDLIQGDLTQGNGAWTEAFRDVDAVIHFAAANPLPDSSWEEALASCDMTVNVLQAAAHSLVRRFVFASSNHVMGAYKDAPLAGSIGPGMLSTSLKPAPGTLWFNGTQEIHSYAYGKSKALSEKICATVAQAANGAMSCVSIRVGWVLPGINDPKHITHIGAPVDQATSPGVDAEDQRNLRWFRDMWLSNGDFESLFLAALTANSDHWPSNSIIVNGVSDNYGSVWDLQNARDLLGYAPTEDVYRHVE